MRKALDALIVKLALQVREVEITGGFVYVLADLSLQVLDARELDFIAQAIQKVDLHFGVWSQRNGMKIQEMGFNGVGIRAESRTVAYVGHGIEAFFGDASTSDVDAVLGNEFFVAAQVDGGDRVF